ncbi:MAG: diacylglycerol kinase family lipid kinase [Verrucomicrobiales bacterium]|nr:diacylglycerol kinase family lipid kinase [Verrucomicrobiales bacterium]
MKHHIILNPKSAGGKTIRREAAVRKAAERYFTAFTLEQTTCAGDAVAIARRAVAEEADAIVVVGGDGTINEVVNGLAPERGKANSLPVIGMVPSGSGGDFCRTFDLSNSIEDAFERIAKNEPTLIDVGCIQWANGTQKFFANIASTGLSAEIGINTNEAKWLKKINGDLAFNWTIWMTTLRHRRFPLRVRTSRNPDERLWDSNCIAICNGQYFGSGIRVAREADPGDGVFDIAVVHDLKPFGFLKGVTEIKKDDSKMPEGITKFQAKWIEISCDDPEREVLIETDGEASGSLPARFEVIPGAIRLF